MAAHGSIKWYAVSGAKGNCGLGTSFTCKRRAEALATKKNVANQR
jgi:hypothetical protein